MSLHTLAPKTLLTLMSALLLLLAAGADAQVTLARWTFLTNQSSASSRAGVALDQDITVGNFFRSSSLGAHSGTPHAFTATGWPLGGLSTSRYFGFSVTADFGRRITYDRIDFTPIFNTVLLSQALWEVRSSVDGYGSALDVGAIVQFSGLPPSQVADISSLGTRQGTVSFRLYFYANSGLAPDLRGVFDKVELRGTESAVPRIYPGTDEDLLTRHVVEPVGATTIGPLVDVDSRFPVLVPASSDVVVQHVSPGGTFVNDPQLLIVASFTSTGNTVPSPFPGLWIELNGAVLVLSNSIAGSLLTLPPGGMTYAFRYPGGLAGTTGVLQALVTDPSASNGIFASAEALELRFL